MAIPLKTGADMHNQRVLRVADPSAATDGANKQYVDGAVQGLSDLKDPVRVATLGQTTLSGLQSVDGIALAAGDRVLVKAQSDATTNGIYVAASGAWSRSADADQAAEVTRGLATTVLEGTTKGTGQATTNPVTWILTAQGTVVIGTSPLAFAPIGGTPLVYVGGAGLVLTGQTFDVGQGNGILVDADAIRVDPAVVARKYAADCAATTNPQTFAHGLGTDVEVEIWEGTTKVFADVTKSTASSGSVTVDWGGAPTAGQYRVVVLG